MFGSVQILSNTLYDPNEISYGNTTNRWHFWRRIWRNCFPSSSKNSLTSRTVPFNPPRFVDETVDGALTLSQFSGIFWRWWKLFSLNTLRKCRVKNRNYSCIGLRNGFSFRSVARCNKNQRTKWKQDDLNAKRRLPRKILGTPFGAIV